MNDLTVTSYLQRMGINEIVLFICFILAMLTAGYNWLYLNHSLHISTEHMGLNAPKYIRSIIKISIFIALVTAFLSAFFLIIDIAYR